VEFFEEPEGGWTDEAARRDERAPAAERTVRQGEPAAREPSAETRAADTPDENEGVVEPGTSSAAPRGAGSPGVVTLWQLARKRGFVRPDDPREGDVRVSWEALEGFPEAHPHLVAGERVLYELGAADSGNEEGGPRHAVRVRPAQRRQRGVVEEYSFGHGYGMIACEDGTRYFLHRSNVLSGAFADFDRGDEVFFVVEENGPRRGPQPLAMQVKLGDPRPLLYRFGQFPYDLNQWVTALAEKACEERWDYMHERAGDGGPHPILLHYLQTTFERLVSERRDGRPTIVEGTGDGGQPYALFDTGLVDSLRKPIYALFKEHHAREDPRRWWWHGFFTEDEGPMRDVDELPVPADYLGDPSLLVISPSEVERMRIDTRHILVEHIDRFPARLRSDPELARKVFEGEIHELPARIRRNYRLAVPQYYRRDIQLLLPLCLGGAAGRADLALVVERTATGARRAGTIVGIDYAYEQARVVARPEAGWLGQAWLTPTQL